jgi:pimeloyl-ACP methyl ester carboxylesterase
MGSLLANRGDQQELLWVNPLAYKRGHLNHLDLAPNGRSDATEGVRIGATGLIWLFYTKMLYRLQRDFETYAFPYDWRRDVFATARRLRTFIEAALGASRFDKVTLVGHSMGGMVIMAYLAGEKTRAHAEQHVQRAITLGTPFRGALSAVTMMVSPDDPKMKAAKALNPANDPQRLLLSFPSIYQILPAPPALSPDWKPLSDLDVWNPAVWQDDHVPIHTAHLGKGLAYHQAVAAADPQVPIYCVVGVNYDTPASLMSRLTGMVTRIKEGPEGGDGTVAVRSAIFKNRPAYYVHEVHVELTMENRVIRAIGDFMAGQEPGDLARTIDDVVIGDLPFRGEPILPGTAVDAGTLTEKIEADAPLDHQEMRALYMPM